jgi:hypothetical protein
MGTPSAPAGRSLDISHASVTVAVTRPGRAVHAIRRCTGRRWARTARRSMALRPCGSQPQGADGENAGRGIGQPRTLSAHTDVVATVFTCTHCNAVPEQVVDGKAAIAIVRHKLGCPTLLAQVRVRWAAAGLAATRRRAAR